MFRTPIIIPPVGASRGQAKFGRRGYETCQSSNPLLRKEYYDLQGLLRRRDHVRRGRNREPGNIPFYSTFLRRKGFHTRQRAKECTVLTRNYPQESPLERTTPQGSKAYSCRSLWTPRRPVSSRTIITMVLTSHPSGSQPHSPQVRRRDIRRVATAGTERPYREMEPSDRNVQIPSPQDVPSPGSGTEEAAPVLGW